MSATAKVIFNMPAPLKAAAQKRAKAKGITLTEFFNIATKAFVKGDLELIAPELYASPAAIKRILRASGDAQRGKNLSPLFESKEEMIEWLGI